MKRKSILLVLLCLLSVRTALAQVNMQVFYDFGSDRKFVTMTLEMFKADKWGNTYFFIDHDFNYKQHESNADNGVAPGGTYLEISRCLITRSTRDNKKKTDERKQRGEKLINERRLIFSVTIERYRGTVK